MTRAPRPGAELAGEIGPDVDVVAFSAVQMATGEVADLDAIAAAADEHGALTVVDATQAVGWLPVDASRFDVVAAHAYKWLMSPRGHGVHGDPARAHGRRSSRTPPAGTRARIRSQTFFGPPLRLAESARRLDTSPAWFMWVATAPALAVIERDRRRRDPRARRRAREPVPRRARPRAGRLGDRLSATSRTRRRSSSAPGSGPPCAAGGCARRGTSTTPRPTSTERSTCSRAEDSAQANPAHLREFRASMRGIPPLKVRTRCETLWATSPEGRWQSGRGIPMESTRRFSRRMFVAWVGGASAGFYLFGRLPGTSAPVALAQIPGDTLDPEDDRQVRHSAADPAGDAEGRHDRSARSDDRLLRDLDDAVRAADPARRPARDDGLGLRRREVCELERPAPPQRAVAHDRGSGEPAGPREVDQRPQGRRPELPAASAPGRSNAALGQPAGRHDRPRHPTDLHRDTRPVHGPRSDRHPRARRGGRGRRQRRLRGGVVPAGGQEHPPGLRQERHLVPLLRGQGRWVLRRRLATRLRHLPVPEREPCVDDLVPRPCARHDAPQRLRRPGRLLPRPRRAGRRRRRDRHAVRDAAVLPGPAPRENDEFPPNKTYYEIPIAIQDRSFNSDGSLFYPDSRVFFDGIVRRLHPGRRVLADLEPGVLRQHDHGQRKHVAVPRGRAAPLPLPLPRTAASLVSSSSTSAASPGWRCGRSGTRAGSSPRRSI